MARKKKKATKRKPKKKTVKKKVKKAKKTVKKTVKTGDYIHKKEFVFLGIFMAAFGLLTLLADSGIYNFGFNFGFPIGFVLIAVGFIVAIAGAK